MDNELLKIENLSYCFDTKSGRIHAVNGVSFCVRRGEILGIVGESGCGKTVTMQCIARLNPEPPGHLLSGKILFDGKNVLEMNKKELRALRSEKIGYVFQNPYESLNPTMRIGAQIEEALLYDKRISAKERKIRAEEILSQVGIFPVKERYTQYPHELSGGMRQRIAIAMALVKKPELLICDEPTTALDVTTEAEILGLLYKLKAELNISVIIITHNISIVARMCDRMLVMYAGEIMESGDVEELLNGPKHPYLKDLLKSVIRSDMNKKEELSFIPGMPPLLNETIQGCPYYERCRFATEQCEKYSPENRNLGNGHFVKCHIPG